MVPLALSNARPGAKPGNVGSQAFEALKMHHVTVPLLPLATTVVVYGVPVSPSGSERELTIAKDDVAAGGVVTPAATSVVFTDGATVDALLSLASPISIAPARTSASDSSTR